MGKTAQAVIETDALTKQYNGEVAVNRLSFNVREGEIFGFLGSNEKNHYNRT